MFPLPLLRFVSSRLVDGPLREAGFRLSALKPEPAVSPPALSGWSGLLGSLVEVQLDMLAGAVSRLVASVVLAQLEAAPYDGPYDAPGEVFAPVHCDVCRHTLSHISAEQVPALLEDGCLTCRCGDSLVYVGAEGLAQAVAW